LVRAGETKVWTLIWFDDPDDRDEFRRTTSFASAR
jgi:hypothetical protein